MTTFAEEMYKQRTTFLERHIKQLQEEVKEKNLKIEKLEEFIKSIQIHHLSESIKLKDFMKRNEIHSKYDMNITT